MTVTTIFIISVGQYVILSSLAESFEPELAVRPFARGLVDGLRGAGFLMATVTGLIMLYSILEGMGQ